MQPILLLTRPERQAKRFQADCAEAFGFRPQTLIAPMMVIQPRLQFVLPPADETLLVTSENALDALFQRVDLTGRRAICVGQVTTKSAQGYGLAAEFGGPSAKALIDFIQQSDEPGPFGHVHGTYTTGDIVEELRDAGRKANGYVVYDQVAIPLSDGARTILGLNRQVILPLFSPRSARLFFDGNPPLNPGLDVVAISPAVAQVVPSQVSTTVAAEPTAVAMVQAVGSLIKQA